MIRSEFEIRTSSRTYQVTIGEELLHEVGKILAGVSQRAFIVTDNTVADLLLAPISGGIDEVGIQSSVITVNEGEAAKSISTASEIYGFLTKNTATRSDIIVALGGGVIGDLAGFVASTFKRGMYLMQVPTTLLSQVDSAIGGKTGLNLPAGKNLVGTFYQPHLVIADTCTLETLPTHQFRNGLAEVIKYGVSMDRDLLDLLLGKREEILSKDPEVLATIVERCLRVKARVIEGDEREESGKREILNYGHTIGHAVETCSGYAIPHGFAVAIGIAEEARLAARLGLLDLDSLDFILTTLSAFELPVEIPSVVSRHELELAIRQDKKIRHGRVAVPLLVELGKAKMTTIDSTRFTFLERRHKRC